MREYRMFEKAVSLEFRRDVARLPMPQFLTKWFCILEGFGHWGAIERLKETRVVWLDAAVLVLGQYHDPDTGETIDYQAAWRLDAAFRDLHQSIAAVCLIMRQVSPMVEADKEARRQAAERQRLDESDHRARLAKTGTFIQQEQFRPSGENVR